MSIWGKLGFRTDQISFTYSFEVSGGPKRKGSL
jgi:hypothetical protein